MLLMMTKDRGISSNKRSIIYNEYKRKNRRGMVENIVQNRKEQNKNPRKEKTIYIKDKKHVVYKL